MPVTEAPYDDKGNLMHSPGPLIGGVARWRPNDPFECVLTVEEVVTRGRVRHVVWRDADGARFPMFLSDLERMLRAADLSRGTVRGTWIVRKRGRHYGIALLHTD